MINPEYRFYIHVGAESATAQLIHPVWKDNLSLDYKMEQNQWFFRQELSGTIDLIQEDYDLVMAEDFGTQFWVMIKSYNDLGTDYIVFEGKFTLADCVVDIDNRRLTVKLEGVDIYNKILEGLDKEFDLIQLETDTTWVQMTKRPAVQILDTATEKVTMIFGNLSFEQDAAMPSGDTAPSVYLRERCHFYTMENYDELTIIDVPAGHPLLAGVFEGSLNRDGDILRNTSNFFYIEYFETYLPGIGYINGLNIRLVSNDDIYWQFQQASYDYFLSLPKNVPFTAQQSGDPDIEGRLNEHGLYSRIICGDGNFQDAEPLTNDDVVPYNRNYKFAIAWDAYDYMVETENRSTTPTKYGKDSNGRYYMPPDIVYGYVPIGQSEWGNKSIWFKLSDAWLVYDSQYSVPITLHDAYSLSAAISKLLEEVAPNVTFSATTAYSRFLYSGNDPIGHRNNSLYITPKSNITNGEYKVPAQTAPITLKQIFDMLKNTYQLYWFLERTEVPGSYRLRIEHIQYFLNGGAYGDENGYGGQVIGVDLTAITTTRNGKPWTFNTNKYEYEKSDMPERYEFGWMDEVTDRFKGSPIEVISPFVDKGKVEEVNINNFTSDVDLMMIYPSGISQDGFALLNVISGAVPVVTITMGYYWHVKIQNGYLSYLMLHNPYWLYNMPAKSLRVNGEDVQAITVQKGKKQTVNVPYGLKVPDVAKLIKTGLGNGMIKSLSMKLTSRMAKVELRYDTEV